MRFKSRERWSLPPPPAHRGLKRGSASNRVKKLRGEMLPHRVRGGGPRRQEVEKSSPDQQCRLLGHLVALGRTGARLLSCLGARA